MKQYIIDPELEKCLPPLDEDRLQDLRDSLSKGYDNDYPLIVWKGHNIIVDGHHRYTICKELGIEPVISERTFESIEDAILYAIDHQKSRRNLDAGQLAIVGIIRFEAEERIKARKRLAVRSVLPTPSVEEVKGESAAIIAEKAGVKKSNIYQVRAVREKGIPELETMIMKEGLSPNFANIIVQNDSREEQKELVKSGIAAVNARAREIKAQRTSQITEEREAAERAKEKAEIKEYKEVLKAQFGDSRYSCGLSSVFEMWCNSCKCAFDIFKPMIAKCCPACAGDDIEKRDESWYPGKKVD